MLELLEEASEMPGVIIAYPSLPLAANNVVCCGNMFVVTKAKS